MTFRLRADANMEQFVAADAAVQSEFSYQQRGIVRRTVARSDDDCWLVLTIWDSPDAAAAAAETSRRTGAFLMIQHGAPDRNPGPALRPAPDPRLRDIPVRSEMCGGTVASKFPRPMLVRCRISLSEVRSGCGGRPAEYRLQSDGHRPNLR